MQVTDFDFHLPDELIARYPVKKRSSSRLLKLDGNTGEVGSFIFSDVVDFINPGDLVIFNNTRVIKARMFGKKPTGGEIEVLIERMLSTTEILVHMKSSRSPKEGATVYLGTDKNKEIEFRMLGRDDKLFHLQLVDKNYATISDVMDEIGHIPLPPYMNRDDENEDSERYQTVYSKIPGAVAAPTAGLHFDEEVLEHLKNKGVNLAFITLHVGAGTFLPVKVDDIKDHKMHSEYIEVSKEVCELIKKTKQQGKRVIAVGTTSMRSLESAAKLSNDLISEYYGETDIFIYPGFNFKVVDALITNFHLPKSTLIMLVSAFGGKDHIMHAYEYAIQNKYRFFSYGDAMFITKQLKDKNEI